MRLRYWDCCACHRALRYPARCSIATHASRAEAACREKSAEPAERPSPNQVDAPSAHSASTAAHGAKSGSVTAALTDAAQAKEAKEAMSSELALLRSELTAAQSARATAEAEAQELRAALAAEKDRAFKAEVDVSDLRTQLSTMDELQNELQRLKAQLEQASERKGGGGLWGYLSGA